MASVCLMCCVMQHSALCDQFCVHCVSVQSCRDPLCYTHIHRVAAPACVGVLLTQHAWLRQGHLKPWAAFHVLPMHVLQARAITSREAFARSALSIIASIPHHSRLVFPPSLQNAVQMPSRAVASAAVVLMGLVWASVGLALLVATEYLESPAAKCAWRPRACHQVHAPKVATQKWCAQWAVDGHVHSLAGSVLHCRVIHEGGWGCDLQSGILLPQYWRVCAHGWEASVAHGPMGCTGKGYASGLDVNKV